MLCSLLQNTACFIPIQPLPDGREIYSRLILIYVVVKTSNFKLVKVNKTVSAEAMPLQVTSPYCLANFFIVKLQHTLIWTFPIKVFLTLTRFHRMFLNFCYIKMEITPILLNVFLLYDCPFTVIIFKSQKTIGGYYWLYGQ